MDFARVVETLVVFFEREGFSYAVTGALGLHAYGLTRVTHDLDLVTDAGVQAKLVPFLESLGYETLHVSAGYSNHLHPDPPLGRVDIIYVGGETSRLLFDGCKRTLRIGRVDVPVPRPEHLAAMKVQAMKNDPTRMLQDMADVQFLLRLPDVDVEEIRGYFERAGLREKYDEIQRLR